MYISHHGAEIFLPQFYYKSTRLSFAEQSNLSPRPVSYLNTPVLVDEPFHKCHPSKMHFLLKSFILALGITSAIAYPTDASSHESPELNGRTTSSPNTTLSEASQRGPTPAADPSYRCRNIQGGDFTISVANANKAIQAAGGITAGTSGYPHEFTNQGKIKWPNARCNPGMHGPEPLRTFEYPVLKNGAVYPKNAINGKKADPGPARAIYLEDTSELCGVVSHENGNMGPLRLCTT